MRLYSSKDKLLHQEPLVLPPAAASGENLMELYWQISSVRKGHFHWNLLASVTQGPRLESSPSLCVVLGGNNQSQWSSVGLGSNLLSWPLPQRRAVVGGGVGLEPGLF